MKVILGLIVFLLILFVIIIFNFLIKANNRVREAFATMDIYLKKRWDLVPNLIEVIKGYAKHEQNTLKEVVELRNSIKNYENLSEEEKLSTNYEVNSSLNKIMLLSESYPDLKADKHYLDLSKQLVKIEEDIANSRKYYNAVVREYNNLVEMFPYNLIAKVAGYKVKNMFEIKSIERENVKLEIANKDR